MLFERTGWSKDKEAVLEKHRNGVGLTPEDVFRNPYMLDFLQLEEKPGYAETDLEGAIIAGYHRGGATERNCGEPDIGVCL
jgi:predicted nuclease of restriction endonuclease-like (RecB) superfamily